MFCIFATTTLLVLNLFSWDPHFWLRSFTESIIVDRSIKCRVAILWLCRAMAFNRILVESCVYGRSQCVGCPAVVSYSLPIMAGSSDSSSCCSKHIAFQKWRRAARMQAGKQTSLLSFFNKTPKLAAALNIANPELSSKVIPRYSDVS